MPRGSKGVPYAPLASDRIALLGRERRRSEKEKKAVIGIGS
jgi:hypothetical protein